MLTTAVFAVLLASQGGDSTAQADAARPEEPKMICRRIPELGSRVRFQRICKTSADWAAEREQNRQSLERAQVNRSTAGGN